MLETQSSDTTSDFFQKLKSACPRRCRLRRSRLESLCRGPSALQNSTTRAAVVVHPVFTGSTSSITSQLVEASITRCTPQANQTSHCSLHFNDDVKNSLSGLGPIGQVSECVLHTPPDVDDFCAGAVIFVGADGHHQPFLPKRHVSDSERDQSTAKFGTNSPPIPPHTAGSWWRRCGGKYDCAIAATELSRLRTALPSAFSEHHESFEHGVLCTHAREKIVGRHEDVHLHNGRIHCCILALRFLTLLVVTRVAAVRAPPEPQVLLRRGVGDPEVFGQGRRALGTPLGIQTIWACPRNVPDRVRSSVSKRTITKQHSEN